jgi:hypothetical protein
VHSVLVGGYNPGLISGMVMFFPLGVYTFRVMKQRMKTPRFVKTVSIGIFIHAIVTIIAK